MLVARPHSGLTAGLWFAPEFVTSKFRGFSYIVIVATITLQVNGKIVIAIKILVATIVPYGKTSKERIGEAHKRSPHSSN
jgi:hypothetical protein